MGKKILIDTGVNLRTAASGRTEASEQRPAVRIGQAATDMLRRHGYEVLFSQELPELNRQTEGAGRPTRCAGLAKRQRVDALLRICVRAAELPSCGMAEAAVLQRRTPSAQLAEQLLEALDAGSSLCTGRIRTASGILLLRRAVCPSVLLLLRLPFLQHERLLAADVDTYGSCIARGVISWAEAIDARRVAGT